MKSNFLMQLQHETAAAFASANPILPEGEMVYETDTKKIKIGDGETRYNALPYAGGGSSSNRSYGQYVLSASQTSNLAVGQKVLLDTKLSGNLPNPVSGVIKLPAGKTFKLQFMSYVTYSSNLGSVCFQLYDITHSVAFGSKAHSLNVAYTGTEGCSPSLAAFLTTTVDTDIEVRITFNNQNAASLIQHEYTTLVIEEL